MKREEGNRKDAGWQKDLKCSWTDKIHTEDGCGPEIGLQINPQILVFIDYIYYYSVFCCCDEKPWWKASSGSRELESRLMERYGAGRSRKVTARIFIHTQEAERKTQKWNCKLSKPNPRDFSQQDPSFWMIHNLTKEHRQLGTKYLNIGAMKVILIQATASMVMAVLVIPFLFKIIKF